MNQIFYDAVGNNPIIAAVKNMKDIEVSCTIEEIQVIFILFGPDQDTESRSFAHDQREAGGAYRAAAGGGEARAAMSPAV